MKCTHRAVLIVTQSVDGTATNVAKRRVELECAREQGHAGDHDDRAKGERWQDDGNTLTTLFRHDEPSQ